MDAFGNNQNAKSKYWVFTVNNYTATDEGLIKSAMDEYDYVAFIRYSREVGESGTPHLQGHLECRSRVRRTQLRPFLPRAWMAGRKGTFEQCEEYCLKDVSEESSEEQTFVVGERVSVGQGKRTDLDQLALEIREGGKKRQLAEAYGKEFIKYSKGIANYFDLFSVTRFSIFHGPFKWSHNFLFDKSVVLWGSAGIGKTEYAKYLLPKALFVSHLDDLGSFNGDYDGVIFDDMSFTHLPRTAQIHLCDVDNQRSIHIRYKTATIPAHTKKIFLTNEISGMIFDLSDMAIRRRLEIINLE